MTRRHPAMMFLTALALSCGSAVAQDEKALEVLKAADAATKQIRGCTYDATFSAGGSFANRMPEIEGRITIRGSRVNFFSSLVGDGLSKAPSMRASLTLKPTGSEEAKHLDIATDGKLITFIDNDAKYYLTQGARDGNKLLDAASALYMLEFMHPTPFSDEINGRTQEYVGEENVGGVACDAVFVVYQQQGLSAKWYFGRDDHLPRRVDRKFKTLLGEGTRTLTISNLDTSPDIAATYFRPRCPANFERRNTLERAEIHLVKPGNKAKPWSLKRTDGTSIALADFRDKVVVLEFWATWCGFCKATVPELQALHEKYGGQPVKVVAISCWDEKNDPAAFLKAQKCTVDLAVNGDSVADAYEVAGLPTFFVIDRAGNVVYAGAGANQQAAVSTAVEKALEEGKQASK